MGIKISNLTPNTLPYSGSEKIPLVQSGDTKAGTLSSFVNYLSGVLLTDSELASLSGNWQSTYTTFTSNSSNYALKNVDNNFTNTQTISVVGTTKVKFGNFKAEINATYGNILFGKNTEVTSSGSNNISIGIQANSQGSDNIVIGSQPNAAGPVFDSQTTTNIALGRDITSTSLDGPDYNILIGNGSFIDSFGYTEVQNNIAIGSGANIAGGQYDNIVIGRASSSAGNNNIIIGPEINTTYNSCILFGYGAIPTADNQLGFGGIDIETDTVILTHRIPITINGYLYYIPIGTTA